MIGVPSRTFREKLLALVCWSTISAGISFLLVASCMSVYHALFLQHGESAIGRIVGFKQEPGVEDQTLYCPQFSFVDTIGQSHTITAQTCSSPAEFSVGEQVQIRYLVKYPDDALISSFNSVWTLSIVFGAGGLMLLLIGLALRRFARKRQISLSLFDFWTQKSTCMRTDSTSTGPRSRL